MKMNRYDAIRINGKDMRRKIMYIHNNINDEETLKVIQVIGDDLNDLWDIHDTIKLDNTTIIILEHTHLNCGYIHNRFPWFLPDHLV